MAPKQGQQKKGEDEVAGDKTLSVIIHLLPLSLSRSQIYPLVLLLTSLDDL